MVSGKNDPDTERRTVLKQIGAAAVGLAGASGAAASTATASHDPGFQEHYVDWDVVDQDDNGDDIIEMTILTGYGDPYKDDATLGDTLTYGEDTLTVYWDSNIFGFQEFVEDKSYLAFADEVTPDLAAYERIESGTEYDVQTDIGLTSGDSDGVIFEFDSDVKRKYRLVNERNVEYGHNYYDYFDAVYIRHGATFRLLHQDDSAGRVYYEAAHGSGGLENVAVTAGYGGVGVEYDGFGGPHATMDSGLGFQLP